MTNSVLARLAIKISANIAEFSSALKDANYQLNSFKGSVKSTLAQITAGFSLYEIGRQMINVTAEFERFESVLTNTLGSNSQAKAALDDIALFAKNTPYQVAEITNAYVRWANLGLDPTIKKMRMLGDVAASLGAGFEQTAEAFKDLMVGQTKRIEEIGISAVQQNGKIQLSFKGLNIEIDKNAEGVMKALEAYSQLNGVLGTQDEIAKSLTGKISNLKDSWDIFLKTVGEKASPLLKFLADQLTETLDVASNFSATFKLDFQIYKATPKELDWMLKAGKAGLFFTESIPEALKSITDLPINQQFKELGKNTDLVRAKLKELGLGTLEVLMLSNRYAQNVVTQYKEEQKSAKAAADSAKTAADLAEKTKKLNEQKEYQKYLDERAISRKQYLIQLAEAERLEFEKGVQQLIRLHDATYDYLQLTQSRVSIKNVIGDKLVSPISDKDIESIKNMQIGANVATDSIAELNNEFKNAATDGIRSFVLGLGEVAQGQITFGDNILKALAVFSKQFGEYVIKLAVTKLGLDQMFEKGIFAGPQGALLAIGAATALMAFAGGSASYFNKRSSSSSSSGIGSGFNNKIEVTGTLTGSGRDLIAVINSTNYDNKYRKGG